MLSDLGSIILRTVSTVHPARAQKTVGTQWLVAQQVLFQKIMFSTSQASTSRFMATLPWSDGCPWVHSQQGFSDSTGVQSLNCHIPETSRKSNGKVRPQK